MASVETKEMSLADCLDKWTSTHVQIVDHLYDHKGDSKWTIPSPSTPYHEIKIGTIAWPRDRDYGRTCAIASFVSSLPSSTIKEIAVILSTGRYCKMFGSYLMSMMSSTTTKKYRHHNLLSDILLLLVYTFIFQHVHVA